MGNITNLVIFILEKSIEGLFIIMDHLNSVL